jgi:hypothetical protein
MTTRLRLVVGMRMRVKMKSYFLVEVICSSVFLAGFESHPHGSKDILVKE